MGRATTKPRYSAATLKRAVGRAIGEARRARGQTQETLAERLEVSVSYLARVEGGGENLTLESLLRFGNALEVPISSFFAEVEAATREGRP